ncbi:MULTISPECIES: hypothetical protein [Streptomyces]|uniref:hypothetical protein n=1 Tax=Streptomyces TaxID=1883 RepID=UPI000AB1E472|nr:MULTISPECIES: hypothetical protein [unclassified Streptomyces]
MLDAGLRAGGAPRCARLVVGFTGRDAAGGAAPSSGHGALGPRVARIAALSERTVRARAQW